MNININDLNPNNVFYYFSEISKIPRGSGNTKIISDYCVDFAKLHNLKCRQDSANNVIIWKEATPGRENDNGVIIQGHMDMVNEKTFSSNHDFEKDGLHLKCEGDYIYAKDTTLGGDDGIAIAYALAILSDDEISHPALEAIFTVDEEIGLLGAASIDLSDIKGRYLLNLDSEDEGIILAGCAGGRTVMCKLDSKAKEKKGTFAKITVHGLQGGHSGTEINKERASAHTLMGRVLNKINEEVKLQLVDIIGGTKDNAIPRQCLATISIDKDKVDSVKKVIEELRNVFKNEYQFTDKNIDISLEFEMNESKLTHDIQFTEKVITYLTIVPQGVQNMSGSNEKLVETSLNMGALIVDENGMNSAFSVRSEVETRKSFMCDKLKMIIKCLGGEYSDKGDYPSWEYKKDSVLRNMSVNIYEQLFNKQAIVETIHAGVECGYFLQKCPWLDIISIGPDILDIHTTEEKMSISSASRTYEFVLEILKQIK